MGVVVQKYGGSSVADAAGVKRVAQRIADTRRAGNDVVVVVSAMGDTTDELIDLAEQVSPLPAPRELDMLLTAGERISMALLAMAIGNLGLDARSFTGSQAGVITDGAHGRAKIIDVTPGRIEQALQAGRSRSWPASRASARARRTSPRSVAAAPTPRRSRSRRRSQADVCEIYSDVDGVFTADPRIVPTARKLDKVTYEEMLEMAACGAKILHLRCVEYARRFDLPIHVRSSFSNRNGSWIAGSIDELKDRRTWNKRSSPAWRTTAARPRSPWSASPTRSARRPGSSRRSPGPASTST